MDLSTGNSGNKLYRTITKIGPGCAQEGAFCKFLGEDVAPKVYDIFSDGYTMEMLVPAPRRRELLCNIEATLRERVWNRPAITSTTETDWKECLKKYDVTVPDWAEPEEFCLVHGDPTASNALVRDHKQLILADPRPPRDYIPQCKETDLGRIVQSLMGWEYVAYGAVKETFKLPEFWANGALRRKAIFWCGAAAARIQYLENSRDKRKHILDWCVMVRGYCHV